MAIFAGNGLVWDKANSRQLCKFEKGFYETNDERIIEILTQSGFKRQDKPIEKQVEATEKKPVRRTRKKAVANES